VPSFSRALPSFPGALPSFPGALPSFPGALPSFPGALPSFSGKTTIIRAALTCESGAARRARRRSILFGTLAARRTAAGSKRTCHAPLAAQTRTTRAQHSAFPPALTPVFARLKLSAGFANPPPADS